MRLARHRRSTLAEMNITPMIDVVFLLLIFFITVSQVTEINRERIELAKLEGSRDQEPATVTINVMRDGEYRVSGTSVSLPQIVSMVGSELDRLGGNASLLTVVIRSDEAGKSGPTNDVLEALARLGIQRVFPAVESPR